MKRFLLALVVCLFVLNMQGQTQYHFDFEISCDDDSYTFKLRYNNFSDPTNFPYTLTFPFPGVEITGFVITTSSSSYGNWPDNGQSAQPLMSMGGSGAIAQIDLLGTALSNASGNGTDWDYEATFPWKPSDASFANVYAVVDTDLPSPYGFIPNIGRTIGTANTYIGVSGGTIMYSQFDTYIGYGMILTSSYDEPDFTWSSDTAFSISTQIDHTNNFRFSNIDAYKAGTNTLLDSVFYSDTWLASYYNEPGPVQVYLDIDINHNDEYKIVKQSPYYAEGRWPSFSHSFTQTSPLLQVRGFDFTAAPVTNPNKIQLDWDDSKIPPNDAIYKWTINRPDGVNLEAIINSTPLPIYDDNGIVPGMNFYYTLQAKDNAGNPIYFDETKKARPAPNGKITGTVATEGNTGVGGVTVYLETPQLPAGFDLNGDTIFYPALSYSTQTDMNGEYTFDTIYYHTEANFTLWASIAGHDITYIDLNNPTASDSIGSCNLVLNTANAFETAEVNFRDHSAYAIEVNIVNDWGCPVKGIEVLMDGVSYNEFTDEAGEASLTTIEQGQKIISVYDTTTNSTRTFTPVQGSVIPSFTTSYVTFTETTLCPLTLNVLGDCDIVLYDYQKYKLVSQTTGCEKYLETNNATGQPTVFNVPPDVYDVYVDSLTGSNSAYAEPAYFQAQAVNLISDAADIAIFVYKLPPEFVIDPLHFGNQIQVDTDTFSSFTQFYYVNLPIAVQQIFTNTYSGTGTQYCPIDTGVVEIEDYISDRSDNIIYGVIDNGQVLFGDTSGYVPYYTMQAGEPNIYSPYTKDILFTGIVEYQGSDLSFTHKDSAVVLGEKMYGTNFLATSPSIPVLILRDPPGDGSYSTWSQDTVICNTLGITGLQEVSATYGSEIKVGTEFEISTGFGVAISLQTEIYATLGYEISASVSQNDSKEISECFTTSTSYSTSSSVTGAEADLFVGVSYNFLYGNTKILKYVDSIQELQIDTGIVFNMDGLESYFVFSRYEIEHNVIPTLELQANQSALGTDVRDSINRSIEQWENMLVLCDSIENNSTLSESMAFDGGGSVINKTSIEQQSDSRTIEINLLLDNSVMGSAGIDIAGIGVSSHYKLGLKLGESESSNVTETVTNTISYTLTDDDQGDNFLVQKFRDATYGTPIFKLAGGQSSCPHEPPTSQRDNPHIECGVASNMYNVDPLLPAFFPLTLSNDVFVTGNIDASRGFTVSYNGTKPAGIDVSINGIELGGNDYLYVDVPIGTPQSAVLKVERLVDGYPYSFDYNNLSITMDPDCDNGSPSTTFDFSVHFDSPLSPVNLASPSDNWLITTADNNMIDIVVDGYDKSNPYLYSIILEYFSPTYSTWVSLAMLYNSQLGVNSTTYTWDVSLLPDGDYKIRAKGYGASHGHTLSQELSGVIDRESLNLAGDAIPNDGVWDSEPQIYAVFASEIYIPEFANASVVVTDVLTGAIVPSTAILVGDSVVVTITDPAAWEDHLVQVELDNVMDIYGISNSEPITWDFVVQQSPYAWNPVQVEDTVFEGFSSDVYFSLENNSLTTANYTVMGIPAWMDINSLSGTIGPNGEQSFVATISDTLSLGTYHDTVFVSVGGIQKHIPLTIYVVPEIDIQETPLNAGWSMLSSYIIPDDYHCEIYFSSLTNTLTIAKDQIGQVYWPQYGANMIGSVSLLEGYQLHLLQADTFELTGQVIVPESTPVALSTGWKIIPYLRKTEAPIDQMLSSIAGSFQIVKDANGLIYFPYWQINAIGNMKPGEGYQISMTSTATLTYPSNSMGYSKALVQTISPSYFESKRPTGDNMNLIFPEQIAGIDLQLDDELAVFSERGMLVGSTVIVKGANSIALWADNEFTELQDGLAAGESFLIHHWQQSSGFVLVYEITDWNLDAPFYKSNGITEVIGVSEYSQENILYQNVPNPFKEQTEIRFFLGTDSQVTLKFYDVLGVLISEEKLELSEGYHSYIFKTNNLANGSYFYSLIVDDVVQSKRMTIIR